MWHSIRRWAATLLFVLLALSAPVCGQDHSKSEEALRMIGSAVLKSATFQFVDRRTGDRYTDPAEAPAEAQLRLESPYNDWRYWNGVLNLGFLRLAETVDEPASTLFPARNIAFAFNHYRYFEAKHRGESKWEYPFGQLFTMEELDDCGAMGASVLEICKSDPQDRYRKYIDRVAFHMQKKQSRYEDSTFVRAFPRKWTLWADDLYMSVSFLARMGEFSGENRYFDDAARQVVNFHRYLFDREKGLMYHCWYSDTHRPGVAFWGRANGWALLAQADLLDRLPENHPARNVLLGLFRRHIAGVARYQSEKGLWHQLLDRPDSYLETSCSAMFTYAVARGVNKGYLDPRHASIARGGWEGVMSRIRPDGQVEGVCAGTSVSDNIADYYSRPMPLNDAHGIGAVLLAGIEVLEMDRNQPSAR